MTTFNNYDQSETGLNIELSVFMDTDQNQRDFNDSFKILQRGGYRSHTVALWINYGNFSDEFSFSDPSNYNFTKKDLIAAMKKAGFWDQEMAKYKGYDLYKSTKKELQEFATECCYDSSEFAEFLKDNFTENYVTIVTRGHCQGDCVEVIISKNSIDQLEKDCKKPFSEMLINIENDIDNLFWNSPVWARLEVNEKEFYLDELLSDVYAYDKDQIIDKFKNTYAKDFNEKDFKIVVDFLADNLPEYPDYQ